MASKYKYEGECIKNMETGVVFPVNPDNSDYQEYLLYDGTTDPQFTQAELDDQAWAELRTERDRLLAATDFFMTEDYYNDILIGQERTDIKLYRTDLRDLPSDTSDPHNVTWPTKPQIVIDNGI